MRPQEKKSKKIKDRWRKGTLKEIRLHTAGKHLREARDL
jgi:hypothetical protein